MLSGPGVLVKAVQSHSWDLRFITEENVDQRAKDDLKSLLTRLELLADESAAHIVIENLPPQHIGLGSKTALLLAVAAAVNHELNLDLSPSQLQTLSNRGGTSGVGIYGFFGGGFIVDSGHPQESVITLQPSSADRPRTPPDLNLSIPIPESWRFCLILPNGISLEGRREQEFFLQNTPVPKAEVFESLAIVYHGMASAVRHSNLKLLSNQLSRVHELGFKARELRNQPQPVQELYTALSSRVEIPIGISSLGPLVYAIVDISDQDSINEITNISRKFNCAYLGSYGGCNNGFRILE